MSDGLSDAYKKEYQEAFSNKQSYITFSSEELESLLRKHREFEELLGYLIRIKKSNIYKEKKQEKQC